MLAVVLASFAFAEDRKEEKPPAHLLTNKAKDVHVVSDKQEPILDFFRRTRLLVGVMQVKEIDKLLEAKKPLDKQFVNYASHNDDPNKGSTFGAHLKIATPSQDVAALIKKHKPDGKKKLNLTLVVRRDDKNANLYHVVGCTGRTPVGFCDNDRKNETDGFSQKDMRYKPDKK